MGSDPNPLHELHVLHGLIKRQRTTATFGCRVLWSLAQFFKGRLTFIRNLLQAAGLKGGHPYLIDILFVEFPGRKIAETAVRQIGHSYRVWRKAATQLKLKAGIATAVTIPN